MGIAEREVPEGEVICKLMKLKALYELTPTSSFHFGTFTKPRCTGCPLASGCDLFPYQELRFFVQVWHATCIETGQNLLYRNKMGSGKGRNQD
jgi:hypothetical protein